MTSVIGSLAGSVFEWHLSLVVILLVLSVIQVLLVELMRKISPSLFYEITCLSYQSAKFL